MAEITPEVRAIADILWKFHNDRLDDPSIREMAPYILPIIAHTKQAKLDMLDRVESEKQSFQSPTKHVVDGGYNMDYLHTEAVPLTSIQQIRKEVEDEN